ncbi:tumor necrosis factor receptor superfamily member wengen isoform X2 [Aethina tumida]|uniref:tumor necrosis factor receptor superfamily member wengen isoform X2 n=1 Tax=Aethina tumida TaxID=116153 RepID=UPI00096B4A39|nr:tumor necrosis factor receptor superfamily member wengen isoform X2 [Aethina tumida]
MTSKMVMVSVISVLLVSCFASCANALICTEGQYWNQDLQICSECSNCPVGQPVKAKCESYRDTICYTQEEFLKTIEQHRYRHGHNQRQRGRQRHDDKGLRSPNEPSTMPLKDDATFSTAETLVWDWQAISLTLGVFACILFFVVITIYSLYQARQWKRLKESYEADLEELEKFSLMSSACKKEGLEEGDFRQIHSSEEDSNRCVYLEQLLVNVRKDEKMGKKPKGNVYIEESI